jgi:hypothetical protein
VFNDALERDPTLQERIAQALARYVHEWVVDQRGGLADLLSDRPLLPGRPPDSLAVVLEKDLRKTPRRRGAQVRSILSIRSDYQDALQRAKTVFKETKGLPISKRTRSLKRAFPDADETSLDSCVSPQKAARVGVAAVHGISAERIRDILRRAPTERRLLDLEHRIADLTPKAIRLAREHRVHLEFLDMLRASPTIEKSRQAPPRHPTRR